MPPKSAGPWIARSKTFGAIDILVNSAGVLIPDNVESMDPADLERIMGVNAGMSRDSPENAQHRGLVGG
jgi:NAD(P)-dependent dehydrogenase (short-subunit alcohol dehydrogenase family)